MSEDLQSNRWWLASDGRWYPPDLHPDVRADAPDEQGRNQALLNATIGVARVRERVFAEIRGERVIEHSLAPGSGETGSELSESGPHRRPDRGRSLRHGAEPLPRFRETLRPRTSNEPNEPSLATRPRPAPGWAPRTRGRGQPSPRATSRPGMVPPEPPRRSAFLPPAQATTISAPSVARQQSAPTPERTWPPARGGASEPMPALETDPPPPPSSSPEPPPPLLQAALAALQAPLTSLPAAQAAPLSPELLEPASRSSSQFAQTQANVAEEGPGGPRPSEQSGSPAGRVLPPSARRRPARVRSTSDLRDAVAGAVARAAAQGPLAPHGPDDEDDSDATSPPALARRVDVEENGAFGDIASNQDAPTVAVFETETVLGSPEVPGPQRESDSSTEYARLAGEQASGAVPPGESGHNSTPLINSPAAEETAPPNQPLADERADAFPELPGKSGLVVPDGLASDMLAEALVPQDSLLEERVIEEGTGEIALQGSPQDESLVAPEPGGAVLERERSEHEPLAHTTVVAPKAEGAPEASLLLEEVVLEAPMTAVPAEANLVLEQAALEAPVSEVRAGTGSAPITDDTVEESPFAFGERRSAARQARKPLPAALQEAVAAGVAQDLNEAASDSGGQSPRSAESQGGKGETTKGATGGKDSGAKPPGIIRRYGSAIAIVVLFLAAGGVAAGIAAFRGPVTPPGPSTVVQDQAASNSAVLTSAQFPVGWQATTAKSAPSSFGLSSPLVSPGVVQTWLAGNKACSADLNAVSSAMTPSVGNVTAVAYSQASTTNPLGGQWNIADAIAFHTSAGEVNSDVARMQSVLTKASAQSCVARFWSASLQAQLPSGSLVMMTVMPRAMPELARKPNGWAMQMQGTETVGQTSIPLRCQVTSFAEGRAQVYFVVSSKGAALPELTAARVLVALATRADRLRSPNA